MDVRNIEKDTKNNKKYRRTVHTIKNKFELVLMCINPNENMPWQWLNEVHFIRIEEGQGLMTIHNDHFKVKKGFSVTIEPQTIHALQNTSKTKPLKLYSIYTRPLANRLFPAIENRQLSCGFESKHGSENVKK